MSLATGPGYRLVRVRVSSPEVDLLSSALAEEYGRRYGPGEWVDPLDEDQFDPPEGCFLVLLSGEQVIAGGGFRPLEAQVCEVKRIWTHPDHRRRGHARLILDSLEDAARAAGYRTVRLETGPAQPEAASMYRAMGYRQIPVFGRFSGALAFEASL